MLRAFSRRILLHFRRRTPILSRVKFSAATEDTFPAARAKWRLLNLICYGIDGRDFTRDTENPKRMTKNTDYYISEFMVGSQFLAYLSPSYENGVWEETKKENKAADIDHNIGFSFDRSVVETEISNVSSAGKEYAGLGSGLYDNYEEMYLESREKIKLAGSDIIK